MRLRHTAYSAGALSLALLAGCRVGPNYQKPAAASLAPDATFKEALPQSYTGGEGWKVAQPADAAVKGEWWVMFHDPQLDALEAQVDAANQTIKQAEANFRASRAQISLYRADKAPTIGVAPYGGGLKYSASRPYFNSSLANGGNGDLQLPFDLNYEIDLWGRIRRRVESAKDTAQADAAEIENARLSLKAELAMDYFGLRASDAQRKLLDDTVVAYRRALQLTQDRYDGGASPLSDVTQAKTQLQAALVQATDVDIARAEYEHAIAVLTGKAPSELTIARTPVTVNPPALPEVPGMLPAQLLERRPDIASAERQMAAANEQIGIAKAAYYPTLSLSALGGFEGSSFTNWFSWPSRMWAGGAQLSQTLYDHGRRHAGVEITEAQYDERVANYRQASLTAFQQVEDNLAALRQLDVEAGQQHVATDAAEQSLDLFNIRYEGGVDTYLQVVTSQTAALQNERNDIEIMRRRLAASVLLFKALGGGWSTAQLPANP